MGKPPTPIEPIEPGLLPKQIILPTPFQTVSNGIIDLNIKKSMKSFTHYEITSPLTYIIHFFLKMLQITRNFVTFRNVANHAYLNGKKCVEELNIFH